MADRLSFTRHPSSLILSVALMAVPSGAPAMAQALADPTQPPAGLAVEAPMIEGAASPVQKLQSVIISPTRKAAIINGVVVELGGKYGDAVLTKVAEDEVVLVSDGSEQVLKLYPAVEKVSVTPGSKKGARKTTPKAARQRGSAAPPGDGASGKKP